MAENTILNPGTGGDIIRDIEKGGAKTEVIVLDYGGDGPEDITPRPYGSGVVTAETPRIVIATDQPPIPVASATALTPASPDAASVDVASGEVVAANASRKGLILVNTSTAHISLGFDDDAVLDNGVTLYPGGTFCMDEYSFTVGSVTAIASAVTSNLAIQEFST